MKIISSAPAVLCLALSAVFLSAGAASGQRGNDNSLVTMGTFKGTLHVGKTESYLVNVGQESGDFAAFCFANVSAAGRAILARCKTGDSCQFSGKVDQSKTCKVDAATQKVLSGSGRVLTASSVRSISGASQKALLPSARGTAPDVVVRDLYAAQKADKGPFFQTKSRALVDKYFTKDFADLIWKDRIDAGNEAGYIDFDPLYNAQDSNIKSFKIGKPEPGEGNLKLADVPVNFKNFGKPQLVLFRLLQGSDKRWRISDIYYPGNKDMPSLKDHLKEYVK
jgi:hypothetical protein